MLEKIDKSQMDISKIKEKYNDMIHDMFGHIDYGQYNIRPFMNEVSNIFYTIADYRRDFNDKYCREVDVLMWGESDSLIPRQTFQILDNLHSSVKQNTPKYVTFFGTCKMWDDSWLPIEHNEFTDKPFVDGDTENWWSLRYNMTIDEMNKFNDKVEDLDIRSLNQYKFNGCGFVISEFGLLVLTAASSPCATTSPVNSATSCTASPTVARFSTPCSTFSTVSDTVVLMPDSKSAKLSLLSSIVS